jgi:hypothetical protein
MIDDDIHASPDRDEKGRYLPAHNIPGPGRDTLYDESMNDMAYRLALLGLDDGEMAAFFGISEMTFNRWKDDYPAFCYSVNEGKIPADAKVAQSLYKRATGEHVIIDKVYTNKVTGVQETVKVSTFIPGETQAAGIWLFNRSKAKWRNKTVNEVSGPNGAPIEVNFDSPRQSIASKLAGLATASDTNGNTS